MTPSEEKLTNLISEYISVAQVSDKVTPEYQELIKDFLFSTGRTLYLLGYFKLESMDIVNKLPEGLAISPSEREALNNDPYFKSVRLTFKSYEDVNLYDLDTPDQIAIKHYIREEFFNYFLAECPDTAVYLDFNSEDDSLTVYTVCY